MTIHRGEKYSIPVKITSSNGTVISTGTCEDVRIKINSVLKSYSESELTYDATNQVWKYPLTEEETLALHNYAQIESAVLFEDGTILKTGVETISISETIITEEWTNDE